MNSRVPARQPIAPSAPVSPTRRVIRRRRPFRLRLSGCIDLHASKVEVENLYRGNTLKLGNNPKRACCDILNSGRAECIVVIAPTAPLNPRKRDISAHRFVIFKWLVYCRTRVHVDHKGGVYRCELILLRGGKGSSGKQRPPHPKITMMMRRGRCAAAVACRRLRPEGEPASGPRHQHSASGGAPPGVQASASG
jgi:hypothetical protein